MSRRRLNRRQFLRGMLGASAATVCLPIFNAQLNLNGTAFAQGAPLPRRFGLFFWGNGMDPTRWVPDVTGTDYTLPEQLQPLANVRDYLTVITGFEVKTPNEVTHHSGASGILTGKGLDVSGQSDYQYPGPSIDQVLADQIGGETRFRSLEFGARPGRGNSLVDTEVRNPPIEDPFELYERVFGEGTLPTGNDGETDPTLLMRQSVLDAVLEDAGDLRVTLPTDDQIRLDAHLEHVRDLELRLARIAEGGPPPAACEIPALPVGPFDEGSDEDRLRSVNRALCDIAVMAVACDQVRVFSNFFTSPLSDVLYDGVTDSHHTLTHHEPGDQPMVNQIVLSVMDELAYMLEAFAAIPEGDGTLLDNCGILATSDVSIPRIHSIDEFPILVAGGANQRLVTGTHIRSDIRENANRVTLAIMRACGALLPSWGVDDGFTEDGLGELER